MAHIVLLLSVVGVALACAPTTSSGGGGASTGGASSGGAATTTAAATTKAAGKRGVHSVHATIVSQKNFDPELNPTYLETFDALIEQHAMELGIGNVSDMIDRKVENIGGKFSVVFNMFGANCDQVKSKIAELKETTNFIEYATVDCTAK